MYRQYQQLDKISHLIYLYPIYEVKKDIFKDSTKEQKVCYAIHTLFAPTETLQVLFAQFFKYLSPYANLCHNPLTI